MSKKYDIAVVGGGMVGAAVALGLAKQDKTVALIEVVAPQPFHVEQPFDSRVSAISHASLALLDSLGVWETIKSLRCAPFRRLATWEDETSRIQFSAEEVGIEQLGFIVENRIIQLALWQHIREYSNVELFCPAQIADIEFKGDHNQVNLASGEQISASLVIAADGANSLVRKLACMEVSSWDYNHHCMLINVETELPQQDITWQWFTPKGPRSFLPLVGHQASLVWYDSPQRISELMELTDEQLTLEVTNSFPQELGSIKVLKKASFPLTRRHAKQYYSQRCVLVGDAAHTINPLAGQGVNLGFKDVKALLQVLSQSNWDANTALSSYQSKRKFDNQLMQSGMDVFYFTFSNSIKPLQMVRNLGIKVANKSIFLKTQALKYALGIR